MTKKSQNKGRSMPKSRSKPNAENLPPDYKSNPIQVRKFRFMCTTAASTATITSDNIKQLLVATAAATTTATPIFGAFRVRRVQLWGAPASGGATPFITVSLDWLSNQGPSLKSERSGLAARPAHISMSPPLGSLAGFWFNTAISSQNLFSITGPVQLITDLELEYILVDPTEASPAAVTLTNTPGIGVWGLALDGRANNNFIPVGIGATS